MSGHLKLKTTKADMKIKTDFIEKEGSQFKVAIYKNSVIKVAKTKEMAEKIDYIVEAHNTLSEISKSITPARKFGAYGIVVPRVKGKLVKEMPEEEQKQYVERAKQEREPFMRKGYRVGDVNPQNIIYNKQQDRVYLIDLGSVRPI